MAQQTNRSNPSNQPSKSPTTREGDEPQDIREAKPNHDHVDSKDGGRDRNPGDMQSDKKSGSSDARSGSDRNAGDKRLGETKETDPMGTGFDESDSELEDKSGDPKFSGHDDKNATDGSHMKNPQPRTR